MGRTWAEQPFEDPLSFEAWKRCWGQRGRWLLARHEGGKGQMLKPRGSQVVKRKLGVELIEAASAFPAMSHTNHETT